MKANFLITIFLVSVISFNVKGIQYLQTNLKKKKSPGKAFENHRFNIKLGLEGTSNAAKTSVGQLDGTIRKYEAGFSGYNRLSNRLFLISGFKLFGKKYNNEVLGNNLNQTLFQAGLGGSYFTLGGFEFGVEGNFGHINGRETDPFSLSLAGIESVKKSYRVKGYSRYQTRYTSYELNAARIINDNLTPSFDELNNLTNNSNRGLVLGGKIEQKLFDGAAKWKVETQHKRTRYTKLVSRFSNGALDNTQTLNPLKELHSNILNIGLQGRALNHLLSLDIGWNFQDDKVFDAEDRDTFTYSLKNVTTLTPWLDFEAAYTFTKNTYTNFKADWIEGANQNLREDDTKAISLKMIAKTGESSNVVVTYAQRIKNSNYKDGVGFLLDSYKENILSSDLNLSF